MISRKSDEVEFYHELNHNSFGNPHEQYVSMKTYLTKNSDGANKLVKLFELNIDLKEGEHIKDNARGLLFSFMYSLGRVNSNIFGTVNVQMYINASNMLQCNIQNNKMYMYDGNHVNFYVFYKLINGSYYNVKFYAQTSISGTCFYITPLRFSTILYSKNIINPLYCSYLQPVTRLSFLFEHLSKEQFYDKDTIMEELSGYTNISIITNTSETYRNGSEFNITNYTELIKVGTDTSNQTLNKITGVTKECKEVTLLFFNNRVTLNDSGGGVDNKIKDTFVLKDRCSVTPSKNNIMTFTYLNDMWYEKSRNF